MTEVSPRLAPDPCDDDCILLACVRVTLDALGNLDFATDANGDLLPGSVLVEDCDRPILVPTSLQQELFCLLNGGGPAARVPTGCLVRRAARVPTACRADGRHRSDRSDGRHRARRGPAAPAPSVRQGPPGRPARRAPPDRRDPTGTGRTHADPRDRLVPLDRQARRAREGRRAPTGPAGAVNVKTGHGSIVRNGLKAGDTIVSPEFDNAVRLRPDRHGCQDPSPACHSPGRTAERRADRVLRGPARALLDRRHQRLASARSTRCRSTGGRSRCRERMMTVSLAMIVRNEEETLPRLLASVAGAFDEIVIVDTGSTDATRRIARRHADRVVADPVAGTLREGAPGGLRPRDRRLGVLARRRRRRPGRGRRSAELAATAAAPTSAASTGRTSWRATRSGARPASTGASAASATTARSAGRGGSTRRCAATRQSRTRADRAPSWSSITARPSARRRRAAATSPCSSASSRRGRRQRRPARVLFYLGREHDGLGEPDEALAAFERCAAASTWDEERYMTQLHLSALLRRTGDYAEAIDADLRALDDLPALAQRLLQPRRDLLLPRRLAQGHPLGRGRTGDAGAGLAPVHGPHGIPLPAGSSTTPTPCTAWARRTRHGPGPCGRCAGTRLTTQHLANLRFFATAGGDAGHGERDAGMTHTSSWRASSTPCSSPRSRCGTSTSSTAGS